jgi:FMN-dependent NADH-azoreductase
MKLLHIIATPREKNVSNTLKISYTFLEALQAKYADLSVEEIDLFHEELPAFNGKNVETKYKMMSGQPIDDKHKESWSNVENTIQHFLSADIYVISSPMWNLSIPYVLKHYIDVIVQPGYLFKYNEQGQLVPLVIGKKMVCITSRGGDYSEKSSFHAYDFQEPYLHAIFGFVGIYDMHFINAQPMDVTPELRTTATSSMIAEVRNLAATHEWQAVKESIGAMAF